MCLIRSAREDSDRAIEQFTAESDKLRQFQMRSMLETRAENFRESLLWLCRAFNLDESSTPDKVLAAIKKSAGDGKEGNPVLDLCCQGFSGVVCHLFI